MCRVARGSDSRGHDIPQMEDWKFSCHFIPLPKKQLTMYPGYRMEVISTYDVSVSEKIIEDDELDTRLSDGGDGRWRRQGEGQLVGCCR